MYKGEKVFLLDGKEVFFVREIESGFLVQDILYSVDYDGDREPYAGDVIYFVEKAFEEPPVSNYYEAIKRLKKEINNLEIKKRAWVSSVSDAQGVVEHLQEVIARLETKRYKYRRNL